MKRVPFSQVLKSASININIEYSRLYEMFFIKRIADGTSIGTTIYDLCANDFMSIPFRGTCVSLNDFNKTFEFNFVRSPSDFCLDYLISFCEYSYNLAYYVRTICSTRFSDAVVLFLEQVDTVINRIGYMSLEKDGITDFVPSDQAAISVAEILDKDLSYKVIRYNHHSMKGDLEHKKAILVALSDKLEPQRCKLKNINQSLASDLFFMLNNTNVRHNNVDQGGKNYIPYIASLSNEEIDGWYDEIYQMFLLAFLELDHLDRKNRVRQLKDDIQNNK